MVEQGRERECKANVRVCGDNDDDMTGQEEGRRSVTAYPHWAPRTMSIVAMASGSREEAGSESSVYSEQQIRSIGQSIGCCDRNVGLR